MCVGPVQERAGQRDDRAGHRGREQHGLALLGKHPHDALDVGEEAEVQHLVGLVEHQRADPAEGEVALLGEVEQAARGADHDVDALAQRGELRLVGAAAVDRDDADAEVAARVGEVLGDLDAELAGGHHDQGLRDVAGAVGGLAVGRGGGALGGRHEPLQQRDAEPERLAHAGAGLADDVLACQREGERELLDGERADDARLGQRRTISARTPSSAKVGESSLTGAPACRGCASTSSGVSVGDSVEFSVGTDRVIASLRAQEPGPARRPPVAVTPGPGRRADEALYAPGRVRLPG